MIPDFFNFVWFYFVANFARYFGGMMIQLRCAKKETDASCAPDTQKNWMKKEVAG